MEESSKAPRKQAERIQTSFLNAAEKKALIWIANHLPGWVTSDMMTFLGTFGSVVIAVGYALSNRNLAWLWLASLGLVLNWLGDSLDGTIARVRNQQRPKYGFFLDHNIDCVNEALMFIGIGLSPLINLETALLALCAYLILSVYVYISAHLKGEFKLTYAKMGPTELRLIIILLNTIYIIFPSLAAIETKTTFMGHDVILHLLDYIGFAIILGLFGAYFVSFYQDARKYAEEEPLPRKK